MVAATIIDATDGSLARLARVKEVVPNIDGARLDDLVDYLTFVFLPALLLYQAGDLPDQWGLVPAMAMLVSSAYGFAAVDAKTSDHFFTGFPSYWNVAAVYLHAARLGTRADAAVVLTLPALGFVRIGLVYPSRTPVLKVLTIGLSAIWGGSMVAIILMMPNVPGSLLAGSLLFPVYYVGLSLVLHARRTAVSGQRIAGSGER